MRTYQCVRHYQAASSLLDCWMLLLHQKVCCLSVSNLNFWYGEIMRNLELNHWDNKKFLDMFPKIECKCNQKVSSFKCETAWEAFKQGTMRRLRNKEANNVKHKGSRFIGKRFFLVWFQFNWHCLYFSQYKSS